MKSDEKEFDQGLKLLARSSVIVLIALIISKLFTYIYRVVIARQFGPEIYGVFTLAIMLTGWAIAISALGLVKGNLRFVSIFRGKEEKIKNLKRFTQKCLLFSTILAATLLFLLSDFISVNIFRSQELSIFLKAFSIVVPFYVFARFYTMFFRAYEKIGWYAFLTNIFNNVLKVILLLILIAIGLNSSAIILSYIFGVIGLFLISYFLCRKKIPKIFKKSIPQTAKNKKDISSLWIYSWPLMFFILLTTISFEIDSFFVGFLIDTTSVGIYNVAVVLVALAGIAPELFMQLFFPLITKEFSRGKKNIVKRLSKQVNKWIFMLNLPLFILLIIFPEQIINLLFGNQYLSAANPLRILALGSLIYSSLTPISTNLISTIGKSKLLSMNIILYIILNIILNIILIPKYGLIGAAAATMTVNILISIIFVLEIRHFIKFFPIKRTIIKISLVSLIPTIIMLYILNSFQISSILLLFLILFFLLFYVLTLFITGCFDKHDFLILKTIKRKITHNHFLTSNSK